jgi:DNA-binding LytR/AlgR family response regulator
VDWFGYATNNAYPASETTLKAPQTNGDSEIVKATLQSATAELIKGSKLPADARLIAIKAEQHYIQIWSDQGTDLVRYRFRDLAETLHNCNGNQVHRSWWVNLDDVKSYRQAGRKLELTIDTNLTVPVSLSYKNSVLAILNKK